MTTSDPGNGIAAAKPASGLYVVATPIGNSRDITLRALDILAAADVIACEDTRTTAKLLAMHGLRNRFTAYHDHNAARARPALLRRLERGEVVALVSDAGTPLINDPGYKLVQAAVAAGIAVIPLPGASSPLAALAAAGLPADRFMFVGFLPVKSPARRRALAELKDIPASLVILEAARRLPAALADMTDVLGPRPAVVARELTKFHEEFRRQSLAALAAHYAEAGAPKGEVVIVIAPGDAAPGNHEAAQVDALLRAALNSLPVSSAARVIADIAGRPRREVYARALELSQESDARDRGDGD